MELDPDTIAAHGRGCGVLGAGGGGPVDVGVLMCRRALEAFGPVSVIDVESMDPDGLLMPVGGVGAPTVGLEKFGRGDEGVRLRDRVEALTGQRVAAVMCVEIGGANGCLPVSWAAQLGLPLVDADGMGRAFPETGHVTMNLAGIPVCPAIVTDEHGNTIVVEAGDEAAAERIVRSVTSGLGGWAVGVDHLMTGAQARHATVRGSVTLAGRIGRALDAAVDPVGAVIDEVGGRLLLTGKVGDVDRTTAGGFVRGSVTLDGLGDDRDRTLRVEFQNENLVALEDGRPVATVPDLICVVDTQTGDAIGTELLRYGQRVSVLVLPCDDRWRTPAGLALVGPRAFGYSIDYSPVPRGGEGP